MSSQTKAEHWGYNYQLVNHDVCDDRDVCDIIMAGGHLKAFASSCSNVPYDPLYQGSNSFFNQFSIARTSDF
jgi:hypothetical protein